MSQARNVLMRPKLLIVLLAIVAPAVRAQIAVFDVSAFGQLLMQVRTLQEQLGTAQAHLMQAQSEFQSMTGRRGMERLLAGTTRNYLPAEWSGLVGAIHGIAAGHGSLTSDLHAAMDALAVLSAQQLAMLPDPARIQLAAGREHAAMLQVLTHQALANTSTTFARIQQLIDAIPGASDQKGILELQARIGAEQGMLQNEQTKLQVLYQATAAERWAAEQRLSEQVIAGHGQFVARFQPVP
jgi:type IV secretion system protein VirB5